MKKPDPRVKKTALNRADRSRLRRQQVLSAARHCFGRIGFHSTSMAQIAAEARMSVGQIYRHFSSKEALIEGIVEEDVVRQLELMQSAFCTDPSDLVSSAAHRMDLDSLATRRDHTALMLEVGAEAARNPKIRNRLLPIQRHGHSIIKRRIESAQPGAWPRGELDLRLRLVYAVVQGVFTQTAIDPDEPSAKLLARLEDFTKLLLSPKAL